MFMRLRPWLVTGISSQRRQEESAFSVSWPVDSIMLLINAALGSNVFSSFPLFLFLIHFLSAHSSLLFCNNPFVFSLFFLPFARCDRSGYDFCSILDTGIIFRDTFLTNYIFKMQTFNSHAGTVHVQICSRSDSTCSSLLESFLTTWGWMTNEISLLLVVWACYGCCERPSERAWVKLPIYWGREKHMRRRTCSQSEPTSAPHTAPIDESSTFFASVSPPIEPHALREAAKEKMDKYRRGQGCAGLAYLAICSTFSWCHEWYRFGWSDSPLPCASWAQRVISAVCKLNLRGT